MEESRLRELLQLSSLVYSTVLHLCRNGRVPIKGIVTLLFRQQFSNLSFVEMEESRLRELRTNMVFMPVGAFVFFAKGGSNASHGQKATSFRKKGKETKGKLQKKTQEWTRLERKTSRQRQRADEFHESDPMALIEEGHVKRTKKGVSEKAGYMVISVGDPLRADRIEHRAAQSPSGSFFVYGKNRKSLG